jgi:hypothetical protein
VPSPNFAGGHFFISATPRPRKLPSKEGIGRRPRGADARAYIGFRW